MVLIGFLGAFHLIHSPLLIMYPITCRSYDICYIFYFFGIMFIYTCIHGECPVSYIAKLSTDPNYIAGSNLMHYPEMIPIFREQTYISRYFMTTTAIYLVSLGSVIYRADIPLYLVAVPSTSLCVYFWCIRIGSRYVIHKGFCYTLVQEATKYSLLFSMYGLIWL